MRSPISKRLLLAILVTGTLGFSGSTWSQGITLEQAIREVSANSDAVKSMRETVKKSEAQVREGWAHAFPVVSASAAAAKSHGSLFGSSGGSSSSSSSSAPEVAATDAGQAAAQTQPAPPPNAIDPNDPVTWGQLRNIFSAFSTPQTSTIYSTSLNVSQPIYTFGKIGTAIKIARQFDQSTRSAYISDLQVLQLQAFDAFWSVVRANKILAVDVHSLERKKALNEFLERNFEMGQGSKAQILATRADAASQSAAVVLAGRSAYTQRMSLNSLMGRPLTDSTPLDTTTMMSGLLTAPLPDQDTAISAALADRQDLKSLHFLAEANRGGAKIYRAAYLPSIGASGSVGYSKFVGSSLLSSQSASWSVGLGVSWTLFDGFSNSAKAAQYVSDAVKLDIAYTAAAKSVEIAIRSAIAECTAADSNYAAMKVSCSAAQESYDLTYSDFKQGKGQFADLKNAEQYLTEAQYRQLRSRAALCVVMGKDIVAAN